MNKRTKRTRIYKSKSKKYYGGMKKKTDDEESKQDDNENNSDEDTPPQGVFDILGDKIVDYSGDVAGYVGDKALRLFGLQPISSGNENETPTNEKINNAVTGFASQAETVGSSFVNVVNKTSGALIGQINGVLESPKVNQGVIQAAQETVQTLTKLLTKFNNATNNPEFKEALELSLNNAADYANVFVEATNEPVNSAIDSLRDSGIKAASGLATGAVKVATDAAAAVPGFGAIIDIGKMINDSSAAFGKVVEAGSETTETLSDVLEKISKNLKEGLNKLNSLQNKANKVSDGVSNFKKLTKDKLNISKRINSSIDNFESPLKSAAASGGGNKTKRIFKDKAKTKRVRFAS